MSQKFKKKPLPKPRSAFALNAKMRSGAGIHKTKIEDHVCDFSDTCDSLGQVVCSCGKVANCASCVACEPLGEEDEVWDIGCKICSNAPCCDNPDLREPAHGEDCELTTGRKDCSCEVQWCRQCVNCDAFCGCDV